jgi:hypothetical protein
VYEVASTRNMKQLGQPRPAMQPYIVVAIIASDPGPR